MQTPRPLMIPLEPPRRQGGWTLIELTVSLLVVIEVILAALMIFDFSNELARVQTQITDLQQSLRVGQYELVRMTRMAGRGGLPPITAEPVQPRWAAIEVRNNVGSGGSSTDLAINFPGTPQAVAGTDILTVRGVFTSPIYQVNYAAGAFRFVTNPILKTPDLAVSGSVDLCSPTTSGVAQDFSATSALARAINGNVTEALILVSPISEAIYAVVQLDPANSTISPPGLMPASCPAGATAGATLAFFVKGGTYGDQYHTLSAAQTAQGLPPTLTSVALVGIVEEYRYYLRQDYAIAGNPASDPTPHLSRARMFPGTEVPWQGILGYAQMDIADNYVDLQVALGLDANLDGVITEGSPPSSTDEWLYNAANDDGSALTWQYSNQGPPPRFTPLYYARISTMARTSGRDPDYQAPPLTQIEDHAYTAGVGANSLQNRMYRRRLLQTVVGLRNE